MLKWSVASSHKRHDRSYSMRVACIFIANDCQVILGRIKVGKGEFFHFFCQRKWIHGIRWKLATNIMNRRRRVIMKRTVALNTVLMKTRVISKTLFIMRMIHTSSGRVYKYRGWSYRMRVATTGERLLYLGDGRSHIMMLQPPLLEISCGFMGLSRDQKL